MIKKFIWRIFKLKIKVVKKEENLFLNNQMMPLHIEFCKPDKIFKKFKKYLMYSN